MLKLKDLKMEQTATPDGVQALVSFGKDYELSIICNDMSYGHRAGLYEIGVFYQDKLTQLPGITETNQTVAGYLNEEAINNILLKMYTITKHKPIQVHN
tara:strand:- start:56 stop:352 length:297 start_codon:yes stop_codon:yes gene_type:complete